MLLNQCYAWDADEKKITATCWTDLRFEERATAIYREQEVWNARASRFDIEVTKVKD